MEDQRQKDGEDFQKKDVGDALQVVHRPIERCWADDGFRVGIEVLQQERSERDDPGQLEQLAQQK